MITEEWKEEGKQAFREKKWSRYKRKLTKHLQSEGHPIEEITTAIEQLKLELGIGDKIKKVGGKIKETGGNILGGIKKTLGGIKDTISNFDGRPGSRKTKNTGTVIKKEDKDISQEKK